MLLSEEEHLPHAFAFIFRENETVIKSHRLQVKTYIEHFPLIRTFETRYILFNFRCYNVKDSTLSVRRHMCDEKELQVLFH